LLMKSTYFSIKECGKPFVLPDLAATLLTNTKGIIE